MVETNCESPISEESEDNIKNELKSLTQLSAQATCILEQPKKFSDKNIFKGMRTTINLAGPSPLFKSEAFL